MNESEFWALIGAEALPEPGLERLAGQLATLSIEEREEFGVWFDQMMSRIGDRVFLCGGGDDLLFTDDHSTSRGPS